MGAEAPSATVTLNPVCLAAIAAASPAGPPPTTKTSVAFSCKRFSDVHKQVRCQAT